MGSVEDADTHSSNKIYVILVLRSHINNNEPVPIIKYNEVLSERNKIGRNECRELGFRG